MSIEQLNAVIIEWIMAGRDHHATVKLIHFGDIGHGRGGGNVQQVSICAGGYKTADQRVFKHIAGAAGILADDDPGRLVGAGSALDLAVVPAQEAAHLKSVVRSQIHIGFPTEAVSAEILSHFVIFLRFVFCASRKQ